MEQERILNPSESLNIITEAIIKTKMNLQGNSFYFLLWGWLVASASFAFFALQNWTDFRYFFLPFPISATIGVILSLWHYNKYKSKTFETYLGYFLSRLWLVLGLSFFVVVFASVSQNTAPFAYTMVIAGIGTLVSGLAMKFRPLTLGGTLFFVFAIASIYLPDPFKVLLNGIAIMLGYLIPGYMLKSSKG